MKAKTALILIVVVAFAAALWAQAAMATPPSGSPGKFWRNQSSRFGLRFRPRWDPTLLCST
jgi:hypothetical protein